MVKLWGNWASGWPTRRRFFAAIIFLTSLWALTVANANQGPTAVNAPADDFKTFVRAHPAIGKLTYTRLRLTAPPLVIRAPRPGEPTNQPSAQITNQPPAGSNAPTFFLAKWQPDAFFLRQYRREEELGQAAAGLSEFFVSTFGSNCWVIVQNGDLHFWLDNGRPLEDKRNLFTELPIAEKMLSTVLNMGIPELEYGTLKWSGNSFTAQTISDDQMEGELITGPDSRAQNLKFTYKKGHQRKSDKNWEIRYSYVSNPLLGYLPSTIRLVFIPDNGPEIPYEQYTIHSLELADGALARSAFDLSKTKRPQNTLAVTYESPSELRYILPNGNVVRERDALRRTSARIAILRWTAIAFFTCSAMFFVLLSYRKNRKLRKSK